MQRILDAVIHGYYWHTSGKIALTKVQCLTDKFAENYDVHRTDNQRAYAKRTGKCNVRLMLYAPQNEDIVYWWLLATKGDGSIHRQERLLCTTQSHQRIRVMDDYELVRRTRANTKGGGTVWSWRMTRQCYEQWRERILSACRGSNTHAMMKAMGSLYRTPGFSGVREQVGKLVSLARHEWRRRHGNLEGLILAPKLGYVERLTDTSVPLSRLTK
jgi:hypothetical protein